MFIESTLVVLKQQSGSTDFPTKPALSILLVPLAHEPEDMFGVKRTRSHNNIHRQGSTLPVVRKELLGLEEKKRVHTVGPFLKSNLSDSDP